MNWMKDSELFADIDEKGRLYDTPLAEDILKGCAEKEISTTDVISYFSASAPPDRRDAPQPAFLSELQQVRAYLEKYSRIGSFPTPYKKRERRYMRKYTVLVDEDGDPVEGRVPVDHDAIARRKALDAALQHNRDVVTDHSYALRSLTVQMQSYGADVTIAAQYAENKLRKAADQANAILQENADDDDVYIPHYERRTCYECMRTESKEDLFFDLFRSYWQGAVGIICDAARTDLAQLQQGGGRPAGKKGRAAAERLDNLLALVNKNALLEYKVLRFIRLWLLNSEIPAQQTYLAALDAAQRDLEEKIRLAADYAQAAGLPFRLQWIL